MYVLGIEYLPPTNWSFSSSWNLVNVGQFGQVFELWPGMDNPRCVNAFAKPGQNKTIIKFLIS